jgi:Flp pilus assembly protein TadG
VILKFLTSRKWHNEKPGTAVPLFSQLLTLRRSSVQRGMRNQRRPGAAGMLTLLVIPLLLLIVGLIVYVGLLRDARLGSQTGADAAALAAACDLATDDLLTRDMSRAQQRLERAQAAAQRLGHLNVAAGERLDLETNTAQDPDGEIVFGRLDCPSCGPFTPAGSNPNSWVGDQINAVQITTRRNPILSPFGGAAPPRTIRARSVAFLDWEVVGFRPFNDLPFPLIPVGVFTDHTGAYPSGWDAHCRTDPDEWKFDPKTHRFVPGQDGIPEVTVVLSRGRDSSGAIPALLLQIGVDSFPDTLQQVVAGVTRLQLERKFSSGFILGADNILNIPGSFGSPGQGSSARHALEAALDAVVLAGEPRIWSLFSGFDEEEETALVTGWMAARVVTWSTRRDGSIKIVLQPAVLHHPAVVAEERERMPVFWSKNRTVCRVRLGQ